MTFEELYQEIIKAKAHGTQLKDEIASADPEQLDCLLHPDDHPLVWHVKDCDCDGENCVSACLFNAVEVVEGKITFDKEKCVGCGECVKACKGGNLALGSDSVKAIELLKNENKPAFVLMAPSFVGQFGKDATPGKIRGALRQIGCEGMVEVAAFADILTLKEALEFKRNEDKPDGFQLTSCCCPVWTSLIKRDFNKIVDHLPPSVSPMIACARIVKQLHPGCFTIFVGPCIAKKAESKETGLAGAVDCVLTFSELNDIFKAFKLDFSIVKEQEKEHSSAAGRLYARTGGVSEAVAFTTAALGAKKPLKPVYVSGVKQCKTLLEQVLNGKIEGNFYEGMACAGGCVGGPKKLVDTTRGAKSVDRYAAAAKFYTPMENPYVLQLIGRLGFTTVEDFLENSHILTREFAGEIK